MRRHAFVAAILLAISQSAFANISSALAQAGSVGGSIGKQDKSISGGEDAERPRAAPLSKRSAAGTQETTPCKGLVGTWSFSNGVGVAFKAGGGLSSTNNDLGKWTCEGGMVAAHWRTHTDHYVISSDGAHMSGNSGWLNLNIALTATKN
jgi:hypothetical protein